MIQHFLPGLAEALERGGGTHTVEDLIRQIAEGDAQLHWLRNSAIVTEINDTPRKRVCHFWLATGDLDDVLALSEMVLEWAKRMGCTQATLAGRRGWERVLASEGWTPALTLMQREIHE